MTYSKPRYHCFYTTRTPDIHAHGFEMMNWADMFHLKSVFNVLRIVVDNLVIKMIYHIRCSKNHKN
jgi:hypothetical protein